MTGNRLDNHDESFMRKVSRFIVKKRVLFLSIFAALVVFSVFSGKWVKVEYNIIKYLPKQTETRQGLELMDKEFATYATASFVIKDIASDRALTLSNKLEDIDGISMVNFDPGSESSYKNGSALYRLTFSYPKEDERSVDALSKVKQLVNKECGDSDVYIRTAIGAKQNDTISKEMRTIAIIVALVVLGVFLFTSQTYAEVAVLIAVFLSAAIINKGTNFLMGTISFISSSVTIVLQLALSVDYAIILCNRFKEEQEKLPKEEAAIAALSKSLTAISASSLTTIAGLAAVTLMQFRIGLDMGLVLIKAIVCSLLSVFLLMPGLLVVMGKLMDKTRHRSFVPKVPFIGRFAYKTRYIVPPVLLLLIAASCIIYNNCNFVYSESNLKTPRQNVKELGEDMTRDNAGAENMLAVIVPAGDYEREAELLKELDSCKEVNYTLGLATAKAVDGYKLSDAVSSSQFADIAGIDNQTSDGLLAYYGTAHSDYEQISGDIENYKVPLISLFQFLHDEVQKGTLQLSGAQAEIVNNLYSKLSDVKRQLQSSNYSRMLVYLNLPNEGEQTFKFIDEMHDIVDKYYDSSYLIGDAGSRYELSKSFETDNTTVGLMSIIFVLIILLFTFKSIALPILLIIVIQGSIWINFSIPSLSGNNVFFVCYLIVSAIQMGANIDYAIVISTRYLDCRKTMNPRDAIIRTMDLAFPTVITSGTMMAVAGLLIGMLSSEPIIEGIGRYVGIGTLVTMVLVTFALPQVLLLGDKLVSATTVTIRHHVRDVRKTVLSALGTTLVIASVFMIVAAPIGLKSVADIKKEHEISSSSMLSQITTIEEKLELLNAEKEIHDKTTFSYAKGLVTDTVGQERLSSGQAKYDKGAKDLASGQAKYDAASERLADAQKQYAESRKKLFEGKKEYKVGSARLDEAKQKYSAGQAKLEKAQEMYDAVLPMYNNYQKLLGRYNEAMANGNLPIKAILWSRVTAAKLLYTTRLAGSGYSIEGLVKDYQDGQAQLNAAAKQILDGQAQLDAAAKQISDGQAQLYEAEEEIRVGKQQLAAAKAVLDEGYSVLERAKKQLDSGRQTLAKNKSEMELELESIKKYDAAQQIVEDGIAILKQNEAIKDKVEDNSAYAQICSSAREYLEHEAIAVAEEMRRRTSLCITAIFASILGLLAGICSIAGARAQTINGLRLFCVLSLSAFFISIGICIKGEPLYVSQMANGLGAGILQHAAAIALLLTAFCCAVAAFWFIGAYKRGVMTASLSREIAVER